MFAAAAFDVKLPSRMLHVRPCRAPRATSAVNQPLPPGPVLAEQHRPPAGAGASALDDLSWRNGFARLAAHFHTRLEPTPVTAPYLVDVSEETAALLGLDLSRADPQRLRDQLAGNRAIAGTEPLAAVYAGHQFGVYVPRLGDGRALLLGGVVGRDGQVWELQLKGSGRTPYSRGADGRAVMRSSIREYLCSEAMAALGVPTTRALSVVGAEDPVVRETIETAAVVTRVARTFVRFGSFEFFHWRKQHDALRVLADYVIDSFFPECRDEPDALLALLGEVTRRTARTVAHWQALGFCHGVMNTDNMSILGLTIDYGPFGFIDGFDAGHVCNHSDDTGRYAYGQQPNIAYWNLHCLGEALLPLTRDLDATRAALGAFESEFAEAMDDLFHAKLGLAQRLDGDDGLVERLLTILHAGRVDWTLFWRQLAGLAVQAQSPAADAPVRDLFADRAAFDRWAAEYRSRLRAEASQDAPRALQMNRVNPKFVLRNHLAEVAIRKARGDGGGRDFSELRRLLQVLRRPYEEQPDAQGYAQAPPDWAAALHLSCSS